MPTPLQAQLYLTPILEASDQTGGKPATAELIETVPWRQLGHRRGPVRRNLLLVHADVMLVDPDDCRFIRSQPWFAVRAGSSYFGLKSR